MVVGHNKGQCWRGCVHPDDLTPSTALAIPMTLEPSEPESNGPFPQDSSGVEFGVYSLTHFRRVVLVQRTSPQVDVDVGSLAHRFNP
jgi:hypothetical protein